MSAPLYTVIIKTPRKSFVFRGMIVRTPAKFEKVTLSELLTMKSWIVKEGINEYDISTYDDNKVDHIKISGKEKREKVEKKEQIIEELDSLTILEKLKKGIDI